VLFPYSIPVLFPAPSLFVPCYELAPSDRKPKNAAGIEVFGCLAEKMAVFYLYFSLLTGIRGRDGFAGDWHHRQTVCSSENCSLVSPEFAAFRRFLSISDLEMGSGIRRGGEILAVFSTRSITSPFLQTAKTLKID
jgi:hypothetical protein